MHYSQGQEIGVIPRNFPELTSLHSPLFIPQGFAGLLIVEDIMGHSLI